MRRSISTLLFLAVFTPFFASAALPSGKLDSISGSAVAGWAADQDDLATAVAINFYIDKATGVDNNSGYVSAATASQSRADLCASLGSCGHGFTWNIPTAYCDGQSHTLYVYAIDSAGFSQLVGSPKPFTCGPSFPVTLPVSSNDGHIQIEAVGNIETVFKHDTDACAEDDIPDTGAHAFRSADGTVSLVSNHYPANYRSIGSTLDTVHHNCTPTFPSTGNPDFNAGAYHEWLSGFYTFDGQTIYGLVHNEWYGSLAEPARCPGAAGWVNTMSLVTSQDGGVHFSHPADYKIRMPQVPWSTSFDCSQNYATHYGPSGSTNVVSAGGYYYTFFDSITPDAQGHPITDGAVSGACLMRTQNLASASSWQVWTGSGWGNALATPQCKPLFPEGMQISSVQYSTYLHSYIALGVWNNAIQYWLSPDITSWSPYNATNILTLTGGPYDDKLGYPTLLDPADTSRSFENVDREPYIYFTQMNGGLNRDLVRQRIRFTNLNPLPTCTPNWSCTAWNQCSASGSQSRTCTDANACGVSTGKPAESQSCAVSSGGGAGGSGGSGGGGTVPPVTSTAVTSAASSTIQTTAQKIAALLAQIQQLQALIAKPTGGTASVPAQTSSVTYNGTCPVITRSLSRGMSGPDVTALQKFFLDKYEGFPNPTGFFGAMTEAALKQWQSEHKLVSSGTPSTTGYGSTGPKTRAAIAACK